MKFSTTILVFFLFGSFLNAQTAEVGYFDTFDGKKVSLHKRAAKKMNFARMDKGCDCQLGKGNVLMYVSKEGKMAKIKQSKIKKLHLEKGTSFCREASSGMSGGGSIGYGLGLKLPEATDLYGLPIKKNGKLVALQDVIFKSDKYILTMYTKTNLEYYVYIFSAKDHSYVSGGHNYMGVGYGKAGKKSLADIKKYFKDCKTMIKALDDAVKQNQKVSKLRRMPVLQSIQGTACK